MILLLLFLVGVEVFSLNYFICIVLKNKNKNNIEIYNMKNAISGDKFF